MTGWRALVGAVHDAVQGPVDRPAPTLPWGDLAAGGDTRPPPPLGAQDAFVRDVMLGRIVRSDPAFHVDAFLAGAVTAFGAVEGAWTSLDPQRSRAYLSPQLWASHRARMELYALHGRRNVLEGLAVRDAAMVAAEAGDGPQRITVRIRAHSADYDVDATGAVVRGDREAFDWFEDWVFERAAGAATPGGGGVLAQRCPNCGATLAVDAEGCCTSCRAPLGTRADWTIVAAQRVEDEERCRNALLGLPEASVEAAPAGLAQPRRPVMLQHAVAAAGPAPATHDADALALLQRADPSFDAVAFCAHVTSAFAALRAAWRAMSVEPVRPYLSESACAELATAVDTERSRGLHRVADDPLVEAVRIEAASDADGFLAVTCAVSATLVDADADASGRLVRGTAELQDTISQLGFRRHSGARSAPSGVSMLRCPRCGAPLRASVLGPCDYCRRAVADGGGDFALVGIGAITPAPRAARDTTGARAAAPAPQPALLKGIAEADPGFNAYDLLADARTTFWRVEKAMTSLDVDSCRDLVEPALAARLDARVAALRGAHRRLVLAYLDINTVTPVAASLDGAAAVVTLRFSVAAEDTERDDTGAAVGGSGRLHSWDEDWALARSRPGERWRVRSIDPV